GNPWVLSEIVDGNSAEPSREQVAAELIVFVRETVRELGERRASGFLKKFYGWYLGRGRFPRPFKQELVVLDSTDEVIERLFQWGLPAALVGLAAALLLIWLSPGGRSTTRVVPRFERVVLVVLENQP